MDALTKEVERIISNILPDKFGLMIDGWPKGKKQFLETFACFPDLFQKEMTSTLESHNFAMCKFLILPSYD